ncbi:IniB N-terminal domain-containing protein [Geodermatophilus sp. CPCC 206100]|uniref:IniB N-terminal domain-containing protein n=1 Tax=Geodermatophilus sp. CPCC 206100 TaxID=3020054 RepID=UPI003B004274
MSTLASTLLDFILDLLRDPERAAAYEADPQGELAAAGLADATPADVAALTPMVTDHATVGGWGGRDRCDDDDRDGAVRGASRGDRDHDDDSDDRSPARRDDDRRDDSDSHEDHHGGVSPAPHAPAPAAGSETVVITHLQNIQYTNTETHVSIDAAHSIWVSGDAQAIFGDDNVVAGGGGVALGEDARLDVDVDLEADGDLVVGNGNNVGNDVDADNLVTGDSNSVGNTTVELDDSPVNVGSGNQAVDSLNGNDIGSHNEDNDVIADRGGQVGDNSAVVVDDVTVVNDSSNVGNTTTVTDSYDDESVDVDVEVEDSFTTDNSVNDSLNGNDLSDDDTTTTVTDESVNVEDNELAIGGENANTGSQEDAANDEFEFSYEPEIEYTDDRDLVDGDVTIDD